jgi:hypothetical protein
MYADSLLSPSLPPPGPGYIVFDDLHCDGRRVAVFAAGSLDLAIASTIRLG